MHSYRELEIHIIRWAEERSIVQNSTPLAQAGKTLEECGELLIAAATGDMDAYRDSIGDVLVTLIVGAACADVDVLSCLEQAYQEIKSRTGTLRPDGVFVKDK